MGRLPVVGIGKYRRMGTLGGRARGLWASSDQQEATGMVLPADHRRFSDQFSHKNEWAKESDRRMGQKVVSRLERYRIEKRPWIESILKKGLGQRSLTEYLWSTSKIQSLFIREHSDWVQFERHELRLLLIEMIHEWIRDHRQQIIKEYEEALSRMTPEEQQERRLRSQLTMSVSKQCG